MKPAIPDDHWIIAYVPLSPRQPMREFRAFVYDDSLGVMVWDNRGFDPANPADMAAFLEAQTCVAKSILVDSKRVRIMPCGWFRRQRLAQTEETVRIAAVTVRDAEEARELAEKAAAAALEAEATAPAAVPASWELPEETRAESDEETVEIPPYEKWSLSELREEALRREIVPEGSPRSKAAWIAALEADDEKDGA